jgi:hypothetical protein
VSNLFRDGVVKQAVARVTPMWGAAPMKKRELPWRRRTGAQAAACFADKFPNSKAEIPWPVGPFGQKFIKVNNYITGIAGAILQGLLEVTEGRRVPVGFVWEGSA